MRITADTNVLVRGVVADDPGQARLAEDVLRKATLITIPMSTVCEVVWVLRSVYNMAPQTIVFALDALLATSTMVVNRPAVEAGIQFLREGGDFADGAMAHEGRQLGGAIFVSFDKRAVRLVKAQGFQAQLLNAAVP